MTTMTSHVNNVCCSASYGIHRIGKLRRYLDPDNSEKLVHAFVSSRLDSCNSILAGLPDEELIKLQRVQNAGHVQASLASNRREKGLSTKWRNIFLKYWSKISLTCERFGNHCPFINTEMRLVDFQTFVYKIVVDLQDSPRSGSDCLSDLLVAYITLLGL